MIFSYTYNLSLVYFSIYCALCCLTTFTAQRYHMFFELSRGFQEHDLLRARRPPRLHGHGLRAQGKSMLSLSLLLLLLLILLLLVLLLC